MQRFKRFWLLLLFCLTPALTAAQPTLRAGVLKFGTVNWELQTIKRLGLDEQEGFRLEVIPYAGKTATATALHGAAVDVIVNDWIWVSRQRGAGRAYSFVPYSRINGALMVPRDSGIHSLQQLRGKRVGIAGGPVDKNWLLIQAVARKQSGLDLADGIDPVYAAPPLLSKKLQDGELDAVITFWHYAARLEAAGFRRLIDMSDVLQQFGIQRDVPMVGYVFSPRLTQEADGHSLIQAFARASRRAKTILATRPDSWVPLKPWMRARDDVELEYLKQGFLAGIPQHWGAGERAQAAHLFQLLSELGGRPLVGANGTLDPGTFIQSVSY